MQRTHEEEGDKRYLSRELLQQQGACDLFKADIFALGISIFELASPGPLPSEVNAHASVHAYMLALTGLTCAALGHYADDCTLSLNTSRRSRPLSCCFYVVRAMHEQGQEYHQLREGQVSMPAHLSKGFQDLVRSMLHADPGHRPAARDIVRHPLLAELVRSVSFAIASFTMIARPLDYSCPCTLTWCTHPSSL